jgi:hypothetical protein
VRGADGFDCKMRLIPMDRKPLPSVSLFQETQTVKPNRQLRGRVTEEGHCEFVVPANQRLLLKWQE